MESSSKIEKKERGSEEEIKMRRVINIVCENILSPVVRFGKDREENEKKNGDIEGAEITKRGREIIKVGNVLIKKGFLGNLEELINEDDYKNAEDKKPFLRKLMRDFLLEEISEFCFSFESKEEDEDDDSLEIILSIDKLTFSAIYFPVSNISPFSPDKKRLFLTDEDLYINFNNGKIDYKEVIDFLDVMHKSCILFERLCNEALIIDSIFNEFTFMKIDNNGDYHLLEFSEIIEKIGISDEYYGECDEEKEKEIVKDLIRGVELEEHSFQKWLERCEREECFFKLCSLFSLEEIDKSAKSLEIILDHFKREITLKEIFSMNDDFSSLREFEIEQNFFMQRQ